MKKRKTISDRLSYVESQLALAVSLLKRLAFVHSEGRDGLLIQNSLGLSQFAVPLGRAERNFCLGGLEKTEKVNSSTGKRQ